MLHSHGDPELLVCLFYDRKHCTATSDLGVHRKRSIEVHSQHAQSKPCIHGQSNYTFRFQQWTFVQCSLLTLQLTIHNLRKIVDIDEY